MPLNITPPLINSSNPWATTLSDLRSLYKCPYTGAVTTRTSTLQGFAHNAAVHQYTFFDPHNLDCIHPYPPASDSSSPAPSQCARASASLNTLGYSPLPLSETLHNVELVSAEVGWRGKGWIISVTGTAEEIKECYRLISLVGEKVVMQLYMEINLSCPNISGKPPPAYDQVSLVEYLVAVGEAKREFGYGVKVGIKTPPYSNPRDFGVVKTALMESLGRDGATVDFITAANTLGMSLLLQSDPHNSSETSLGWTPTLSSADAEGIGGLAGSPLHPLALGNVRMLRRMLDSEDALRAISIVGIGGVSDAAGFGRMKSVGAEIVGVGTALGRKGVDAFREISFGPEARL
ncbi:hypothetical protein FKW77_006874 [Venturia effusa]|uniref:Dihydroorotate dehydrogenase (fumarate) n=1 Tax=Venturia effusa TaxID=50376 RepID=A0A517LFS4_9PEZI|nr:hypothetical protein FKW77_006874 [Venturia effusa]